MIDRPLSPLCFIRSASQRLRYEPIPHPDPLAPLNPIPLHEFDFLPHCHPGQPRDFPPSRLIVVYYTRVIPALHLPILGIGLPLFDLKSRNGVNRRVQL